MDVKVRMYQAALAYEKRYHGDYEVHFNFFPHGGCRLEVYEAPECDIEDTGFPEEDPVHHMTFTDLEDAVEWLEEN